ncbi:unnamed protein product, partial [Ectocarpus sp. 12 AP-2014]
TRVLYSCSLAVALGCSLRHHHPALIIHQHRLGGNACSVAVSGKWCALLGCSSSRSPPKRKGH